MKHVDDGVVDVGVAVAEDVRGKGGVVVDVFVAVDIPKACAFRLRERDARLGAAIDRREAAGDDLLVIGKQLLRT